VIAKHWFKIFQGFLVAKKQKFILGVGAQKAGTTWLWSYLNSIDAITLTRPKELHIFDAMLRPESFATSKMRATIDHLSRSPKQKFTDWLGRSPKRFVRPIQRVEMIENPQAYVDFFKTIDPAAQVVGEITPSYSTLRPEHFRFIADTLEPHFDVRVIFLMRDPVSRAFSGVKQSMSRLQADYPHAFAADANAQFEAVMMSSHIVERQDYEGVLKSLDDAFAPDKVHVDFFERLFHPDAAKGITEFLGVPYKDPDFERRVNPGIKAAPLDPELASRARTAYASTYAYCYERFGAELIDELWEYATFPVA